MTRAKAQKRDRRPAPPLIEFPCDRPWYRVHRSQWAGNVFNPNTATVVGGRFHPFRDARGAIVPTLYLADHPQSALRETLFRRESTLGVRPASFYHDYRISTVAMGRTLKLLDLAAPEVVGYYMPFSAGGEETYSASRRLAATLMALHTEADGIVWSGRQAGVQGWNVAVLFGGRVSAADIEVQRCAALTARRSLELRDLRICAAACGARLPVSLCEGGR